MRTLTVCAFRTLVCVQNSSLLGGASSWTNRGGAAMTYWGGSNSSLGGCGCGAAGYCAADATLACSCDRSDGRPRSLHNMFMTSRHIA